MRRTIIVAALALAAALPATSKADTSHRRPADPVVEWNRLLLDIQATPGAQPPTIHPTYELALVHQAVAGAVDAPRPRASPVAAADSAAHAALLRLYPASGPAIDAEYADL